jgi:hypothetical protein
MKFKRFFLYLGLSMASATPTLSHAQIEWPVWLQPEWIHAKLMDFHARNTERFNLAESNANAAAAAAAKNGVSGVSGVSGATNPQNASVTQPQQPQFKPQLKPTGNLAPIETAVPKMNEKYLSAEELKELRKQLSQRR